MTALVIALILFGAIGYLAVVWLIAGFVGRRASGHGARRMGVRRMSIKVYIDRADWWIGYYRGPNHHYVCPLPTVVVRWVRRNA
jgi:hypothetical protein